MIWNEYIHNINVEWPIFAWTRTPPTVHVTSTRVGTANNSKKRSEYLMWFKHEQFPLKEICAQKPMQKLRQSSLGVFFVDVVLAQSPSKLL